MEEDLDIKKEFQSLEIIYYALIACVFIFYMLVYFVILKEEQFVPLSASELVHYIGAVLIILNSAMAYLIKENLLSKVKLKTTNREKVNQIRIAYIVLGMGIESALIINVVILMLYPASLTLICILSGLVIFYILKPTSSGMKEQLQQ